MIKGETIQEAIKSLDGQVKVIQKMVKKLIWNNDFSVFEDKVNFTTAPDFIIDLFDVIRNEILYDKILFILLDEYDELDEYQQKFINNLIRTRTLSFKIASKIGGIKTLEYARNRELDEIHDYDPIIPLHFETSRDNIYPYRNLLKNIFIRRLNVFGNYRIIDPEVLLPSPTMDDENITEKELKQELKLIRRNMSTKREIIDPVTYWKNFEGHYREAAIYRLLRKKRKDKLYAGFGEYVSLSSGIVRQFILLCRDAFSLAHAREVAVEEGQPIPIGIQSDAATHVSRNQLTLELTKSIPSGYGPKLVRFIQDLGRILQAKLYYSTEPQANRFEIIDSEKLAGSEYEVLRGIIENGLRMPHFISELAFLPKQPQYSFPFTFSLNAIFAPILRVPPEKRWRTPLRVDELRHLCSDENREEIMRRIINEIREKTRPGRGKKKKRKENDFQIQQKIPDIISPPITPSNCPITGQECDKNLTKYMIEQNQLKAFLAVPFDMNSWVYDPREWIKTAMSDQFNVRCVDADDFPNVGTILCKICSCVRQMPIGLFEITELNPNVLFELGIATALKRLSFLLVYRDKIPRDYRGNYPPNPLGGIEYVPYELSQNAIIGIIEKKILPTIDEVTKHNGKQWCLTMRKECKHKETKTPHKILIGLPYERNQDFFREVEKLLRNVFDEFENEYELKFYKSAKSQSEPCQLCTEIRESLFCILDTTYNDTVLLFALGMAFGNDKKSFSCII